MIRRLLAIDPEYSRWCGGGQDFPDVQPQVRPVRRCVGTISRAASASSVGIACRVGRRCLQGCKKPLMPSVRSEEVRRDRMRCCDCCRRIRFWTAWYDRSPGYLKEAIRDLNTGVCAPRRCSWEYLGRGLRGRSRLGFRGVVIPIPLHRTVSGREIQPGRVDRSRVCLGDWCETRGRRTREGQRHCGPNSSRPVSEARNVKGAFAVRAAPVVTGKDVTLVDDVMTTGSTLNEAACVLRSSGARRVFGAVCASGLGQPCGCRQGDRILLDGVE